MSDLLVYLLIAGLLVNSTMRTLSIMGLRMRIEDLERRMDTTHLEPSE